MLKILAIIISILLMGCSHIQYSHVPSTVQNPFLRTGFRQQSLVIVVPLVMDMDREIGSRTVLDARMEITTTTQSTESKKVTYPYPNGWNVGFRWRF